MRKVVLCAGAFALLSAFSLAPAAKESATSDLQVVCKDGATFSVKTTRGACSGHGGVAKTIASSAASASNGNGSTSASSSSGPAPTSVLGAGAAKVWANPSTKVYHCAGDPFYGKTKRGEYISEAEAKDHGFRPDHGKACAERTQ